MPKTFAEEVIFFGWRLTRFARSVSQDRQGIQHCFVPSWEDGPSSRQDLNALPPYNAVASAAGIFSKAASHSRDCLCHASHMGPL